VTTATLIVKVGKSVKARFSHNGALFNGALLKERTQMSYIDWPGKSGTTYRYWFLERTSADGIQAAAGNYAFVKKLADGTYTPLYFGEGGDLQARIPNHDRWDDARRAGMTHVMAHKTEGGEKARLAEEYDLIQRWNPPLNVHHRKVS
jgi:hypothetical protein